MGINNNLCTDSVNFLNKSKCYMAITSLRASEKPKENVGIDLHKNVCRNIIKVQQQIENADKQIKIKPPGNVIGITNLRSKSIEDECLKRNILRKTADNLNFSKSINVENHSRKSIHSTINIDCKYKNSVIQNNARKNLET